MNNYATKTELSSLQTDLNTVNSDLAGYVQTSTLNNYITSFDAQTTYATVSALNEEVARIAALESSPSGGLADTIIKQEGANVFIDNTVAGTLEHVVQIDGDGNIQCMGDITVYSTNISDRRFKEGIIDLEMMESVDIVNSMRPVEFKWKDNFVNKNLAKKRDIGFIAQELEELSEYVVRDTVDGCKYIKYERIIPYMIKTLQYLLEKVK